MENLSLSENCKTWTLREWLTKIIGMPHNKEDFNLENSNGETILICAVKYANCMIIQQILNARDAQGYRLINIDAQDNNGNTALVIACTPVR